MAYMTLKMSKVKLKVNQNAGFSDVFNWRSYSNLQKLLTVVISVIAVSWLSSLWTLAVILVLAVAVGINLSKKISHPDTGEFYVQTVTSKLKEYSHYVGSLYVTLKFIAVGQGSVDTDETSNEVAQISDKSSDNLFGDDDKDVFTEDLSSSGALAVKVPCDVYLEINSLQLLIIRDFVRSWYCDFSYDPAFLKESKCLLQHACNNIVYSLSCQNPKIVAITLLKHFQVHVGMFGKAKASFESHQIHPKTKVPTLPSSKSFKRHTSIDEAFEKEFNFHDALLSDELEYAYLRGVISIVLLSIVPDHVAEGKCAKSLLIEILTANVMLPLVELVSDPDWLMEKIILLTSDEKLIMFEEKSDKGGEEEDLNENKIDALTLEHKLNSSQETVACSCHVSSASQKDDTFKNCDSSESNDCEKGKDVCTEEFFSPLHDFSASVESSGTFDDVMSSNTNTCDTVVDDAVSCIEPEIENAAMIEGSNTLEECHSKVDNSDNQLEDSGDICKSVSDTANALTTSMDSDQNCLSDAGTEDCVSNSNNSDMDARINDELLSSEELFSSDSYENMELDPQKIISYTTQDFHESSKSSDQIPTSFPKLSSIKNFFVDSFKTSTKGTSGIPKPKSLALFSDKLTSNLNPLSSKLSVKKGEKTSTDPNQIPPQLLVDGKPVLVAKTEYCDSLESSQNQDDLISPISVHSSETSPGFFTNTQPFFSKSTSQTDLYSTSEILEESPILTPSPTSHPLNSNDDSNSSTVSFMPKQTDMSKSYVADDRRIFQGVTIPKTLTQKEFGSSSRYSLYVIEYEALYFTEEGKSVLKSGTVKRRYREFNNLQSRLEGYPTYKKYLKNIKGPKRWPTLPFKTLDKDTVQNRRIFMEKYLSDLIQIEAICNGPDLREFLAYEGDSHIAFVKKSPDVNVLRIDKMLMRGMSEVVDRLKALPNIPQEVMSGFRGREVIHEKTGPTTNHIEWDTDMIAVDCDFDGDVHGNVWTDACREVVSDVGLDKEEKADLHNVSQVIKEMKSSDTIRQTYEQEIDKVLSHISNSQDSQRSPSTASDASVNEEKIQGISELSEVFLDLMTQGLQGRDHWLCKENVLRSIKVVFGNVLNKYLEEVISDLTSNDQLVTYLRLARNTIWPQGQLWTESRPQKSEAQKEVTRQQAKRCLTHFFPAPLRLMVGQDDFEAMIEVFLGTLQNEKLNRHLLYQLVDSFLEQLFPEVTNKEMLHKLLFSRSSAEGYV